MDRILKNPIQLFKIVEQLNAYNIKNGISFRKTVEKLNFDLIYDEILDFIDSSEEALNALDLYISMYG